MVNANRTDSLLFEYTMQIETFNTISNVSKSSYISGSTDCLFPTYESNNSTMVMSSVKPFRIVSSRGYVSFVAQNTERKDLSGGYAMDRVEIFDYNNQLIKKYNFRYKYSEAATACASTKDCFRLMLDSLWEEGRGGVKMPPHTFTYNTMISPPSRLSAAQDHWGYFNGATQNFDLVPSIIYIRPGNSFPTRIEGADREVNPETSQFGMLTEIRYPTKGTTSFEYENNTVNQHEMVVNTVDTSVVLSDVAGGQGVYGVYQKTFTVNVPAIPEVNGGMSGSFASIRFGNLGCDISGGANLCANLTLEGVSNGFSLVSFVSELPSIYLPNGEYIMKAEFYQDPPAYGNFFYGITWSKADSEFVENRFIGGLRVSKIVTHDGSDHQKDIVRTFRYLQESSEIASSGNVFGIPFY